MGRLLFTLPTVGPGDAVRIDTASGSNTPADIVPAGGGPAITGAVLHAGEVGQLPRLLGPADGTTTLYLKQLNYRGTVTGSPVTLTGVDLDAAGPDLAGKQNVIVHGSTAGTARPASATFVHWVGSVAPTNAATNDEWTDTANKLLKRWNGTSWDSIGSGSFSPFASPDLISGDSAARSYVPSFTKYASNPIFQTVNLTTLTSMQWPWLLRVDDIFGAAGPYGESYRIYYSTDHETTTAGIGLLTATSLTGPWTDRGLVFRDAGGNQTETATVIYVPETQLFHMYYHQNSATGATSSQVTKLATMSLATAQAGPDSWTISTAVANGIVFDVPADGSSAWPPNGGWGYARPFRVGQKWYAHLLIAGTLNTYFALAYSRDGITWRQDARPLVYAANVCNDVGGRWNPSSHYVAWNSGTVFPWKGQLWWNGLMFSYIGGGGASTFTYDVVAPISADFRKLLGPPSPVFTSSQGWETSYTGAPGGLGDFRSGGSMIAGADGKLYKVYSGGTQGLGLAVGS